MGLGYGGSMVNGHSGAARLPASTPPRRARGAWALAAWLWCCFGPAPAAWALLPQTSSDLAVLTDQLRQAMERSPSLRRTAAPVLVATPLHHWVESRSDFASLTLAARKETFSEPGELVVCPDCDTWRLRVKDGSGIEVNNGELSLTELARLRQDPRYGAAKSVVIIRETPSGIDLRLTSLIDGRVLFQTVADSTQRLNDVKPYLHYAAERDRRLRGESLTYAFVNIGLYPQGLFQLEFLEQWGERNQHISGIGLSLFNPNLAVGLVYHYMLPRTRRFHVAGALYLPLQNALQSTVKDEEPENQVVAQVMAQYSFANSFGVFASISSQGTFSLGLNLYNPLLMPFLL